MIRFSVLASSSRGNATVVSGGGTHVLVDTGISALRIRKGLEGDRHVVIDANGLAKDGRKVACEVAVSSIDLMNPGDLIIADDSGICAVPPQHAAYVLKKCQQILPDEEIMRELIERDAPISEIKKLFRKRYTDDDQT